jgi:hypothetical protein
MLKALLNRAIDNYQRDWNYDASYLRHVLDLGSWPMIQFFMITSLGRRREAPLAALMAAGLVGTLTEDCGPCTQLGVDMATKAGVGPARIRGILAGDREAMGPDAALAYDFAHASLARDMERADPLRDEIVRRWGEKALTAISLTLMTARMYPTLKYALGAGKTCSKIVVAGAPAPLKIAA